MTTTADYKFCIYDISLGITTKRALQTDTFKNTIYLDMRTCENGILFKISIKPREGRTKKREK